MWEIQCAWCGRMIGGGAYPVGVPLPLQSAESHGICCECVARVMAARAIQGYPGGATDHSRCLTETAIKRWEEFRQL